MFDNSVFNVVTGLVFIFLLYSLLATAMQEAIANVLQRRASTLQYGIKAMLTKTINNSNKSKLALIIYYVKKAIRSWWLELKSFFIKKTTSSIHERFYNHPIIKNYGQNSWFNKPSYLGAHNFSEIIIDTLKNIDDKNTRTAMSFDSIKNVLNDFSTDIGEAYAYTPAIPNGDKSKIDDNTPVIDKETLQILNHHLLEAGGDLDIFRSRLEQWFDDTMGRVSGWYKRNTHYWLFAIGLFLAVTLNIDTIEISNYLSKNKAAADRLAKMGEAAITSGRAATRMDSVVSQTALDSIKKDIQEVNTLIGLGWGDYGLSDTVFIKSISKKHWITFDGKWYTIGLPIIPHCIPLEDTFKIIQSKGLTHQDFYKRINDSYPIHLKATYIFSKIGWQKFFGFFITAIAIGLGAPFWYDLLNRIVSVRSAGKKIEPASSGDKDKADG